MTISIVEEKVVSYTDGHKQLGKHACPDDYSSYCIGNNSYEVP